jgi:hypothetical protein
LLIRSEIRTSVYCFLAGDFPIGRTVGNPDEWLLAHLLPKAQSAFRGRAASIDRNKRRSVLQSASSFSVGSLESDQELQNLERRKLP